MASKTRKISCARAIWSSTCTRPGEPSISTIPLRAISIGAWWITSNGSAAGPSALGCGSWIWKPRRAASAPAPICLPKFVKRMASHPKWWHATRQKSSRKCSRISPRMFTMTERLFVTCRTARASDTDDVMELTSTIWDGGDYVPQVWAEWLLDQHGRLVVAEYEGKVVGLGKLTRLSDQDWW